MASRTVQVCGGEPAVRKGPWTLEEDLILVSYISEHGEGSWDNLARAAGLNRNGKSCRLRWLNYLRPGVRRGSITPAEDAAIRELQALLGNKWSKIAKHLPGRTDNEIKNYWRTRIQKRAPPPSATAQHQKLLRRQQATAAAISEGASSSSGTSASQDSSGAAASGDCCFMTQPKTEQRRLAAYSCQLLQEEAPVLSAAAPAPTVKSEGGASSAFASQASSTTTAGDDWFTQQASYPYYQPSGLIGSAAEHHLGTVGADANAATTAQFFASADQFSDSLWNAVNSFWETIPVKGAF